MSIEATVFAKDLLEAIFPPEEVRTDYRGLSYVEDERVMDRLTDVLGAENWHVADATAVSDRVVRLTIAVRWPETTEWLTYTDFGYPNKADAAEPLKEAWTDAFRRVGRLVGIARYLYLGEGPGVSTTQGQGGTSASAVSPVETPAPAAPAVPQQPVAAPIPSAPGSTPYQNLAAGEGGACPTHGTPWTVKEGGTSKAGKAYNAFWKCDGKTNGSFCNDKPSKAWVDAHPIG